MRFLGDTFLFNDEEVMPHLGWRTAVLETDRCKAMWVSVRGKNLTGGRRCNNNATIVSQALGPSPDEDNRPWQTKPERDESSLAPFRVSNELRRSDALQQANLVTKQLQECHLDSSPRVALKPLSLSRDPIIIEAESKHGQDTAIVLSVSNPDEKNVYHIMHMHSDMHCLFLALQNAASSPNAVQEELHVILPTTWASPVGNLIIRALSSVFGAEVLMLDQNHTYIQQQTYRRLVHVHGPDSTGTVSSIVRSGSLGFLWPLWDSFKFELGRVPSSFGIAYANAVRRGNMMQLSEMRVRQQWRSSSGAGNKHVLVVQRRNSRRLVGSQTGTFAEVINAMCGLDLPVVVVEFETMTVEEQIQAVSTSAVMVAAHGAGISHAAWMKPGMAVVEVLMRQGFAGSDYHKADFGTCAFYDLVTQIVSCTFVVLLNLHIPRLHSNYYLICIQPILYVFMGRSMYTMMQCCFQARMGSELIESWWTRMSLHKLSFVCSKIFGMASD